MSTSDQAPHDGQRTFVILRSGSWIGQRASALLAAETRSAIISVAQGREAIHSR